MLTLQTNTATLSRVYHTRSLLKILNNRIFSLTGIEHKKLVLFFIVDNHDHPAFYHRCFKQPISVRTGMR